MLTARDSSKKLIGVQYLRAIAAISVVVYHAGTRVNAGQPDAYWPEFLKGGVDLFFVISGFIMVITTLNGRQTPWSFWKRRLTRVAPAYWITTSFALVLTGWTGWHTVASYLFIPAVNANGDLFPVLPPGWTLNYEMAFYSLFAVTLMLGRWQGMAISLLMAAGIALWHDAENPVVRFYFQPILFEFALGMGIAHMRRDHLSIGATIAITLALASLVAFPENRLLTYGLPAAAMVMLSIQFEPRRAIGWLEELGNASYSIYLIHPFMLTASYVALRTVGLPMLTVVPLGVLTACLAGLAFYRVVEKPLGRYFHTR